MRLCSRNQLPVARRLELVVGEDLEVQVEAAAQLVLPLLGQAAGADHEAALQVAAHDELLHQQAGHDRLARAGVVGQHKAQRLARQHRFVHGRDLVRQRLDVGGMDGQQRVEEVGQADALRLGHQAEEGAVAVKAPGAALLDEFQARFVMAEEQLVGRLAGRRFVGKLQGFGAVPLHVDDRDEAVGQDATEGGIGLEIFEADHRRRPNIELTAVVAGQHGSKAWPEQIGAKRQTALCC